jgi:hypothetical protein
MQEKQTAGNFRPTICDTPCSSDPGTGTLVDIQNVELPGQWATILQWFSVAWQGQTQDVNAIVTQPNGTILATGSRIQATVNASGVTFSGID